MMTQVSRYKLTLSYDGQAFFGWQVQPEYRTVQGVLQENLEKLLQEEIYWTKKHSKPKIRFPYQKQKSIPEIRFLYHKKVGGLVCF